jgi:hypothetical protein
MKYIKTFEIVSDAGFIIKPNFKIGDYIEVRSRSSAYRK